MSALPPEADIGRVPWDVRFVPRADPALSVPASSSLRRRGAAIWVAERELPWVAAGTKLSDCPARRRCCHALRLTFLSCPKKLVTTDVPISHIARAPSPPVNPARLIGQGSGTTRSLEVLQ